MALASAPAAHATLAGDIAAAPSGSVVQVPAGDHSGPLLIDKPLTLRGEGPASVIHGEILVTGDDVTIEQVTVRDAPNAGITLSGAGARRVVQDSVITDNGFGMYANGADATIRGNTIQANDDTSVAAGGNGIYSDQGANGLVIDDNTFVGPHPNASIVLAGSDPATQKNIQVTGNDFGDNLLFMVNTSGALVQGNTSASSITHGVQLAGGNAGTRIEGNRITNPSWSALRVSTFGTPNRGVEVVGNHLTGAADYGLRASDGAHDGLLLMRFNRIAGNLTEGVLNDDADAGDSIRAEDNWWGCNAGASAVGCDTAVGGVDATPHLVLSLTASRDTIITGGDTSEMTASLRRNSVGDTFSSVPLPNFDVGFATDNGTIATPASAVGGAASSTLQSGLLPGTGTANVTATLDDEDVTEQVAIAAPGLEVVAPEPRKAQHGQSMTTAYDVSLGTTTVSLTNVQVTDEGCSPVGAAPVSKTGGDDDTTLEPGETWRFECTTTMPEAHVETEGPLENTVTATGTPALGPDVAGIDTYSIQLIHPQIQLDASAPDEAEHGQSVTRTYVVTAIGSDVPLEAVDVQDDECADVGPPTGDVNADDELNDDETWTFACTTTMPAAHSAGEEDPVAGTATVTGRPPAGPDVSATSPLSIDLLHPQIQVDVSGPAEALQGESVTLAYAVTANESEVSVNAVQVTDDACAPVGPEPVSKTGGNDDPALDRGETWTFECTATMPDGPLASAATASGTTPNTGATVTASDSHTIGLASPPAPPPPPSPQQTVSEEGPPPDTTGPQIAVVRRTLRMSRKRIVKVRLFCPQEEVAGCPSALSIRTANPVRLSGRKRTVRLATDTFTLPPGRMTRVGVRLSKKKARLVKRLRRVRVAVTVASRDSAGNETRVGLGMQLVAPRRRR